jgi:hypothetical protein
VLKQRRLVLALGSAAGGLAAAAFFQTPFAHADVCDLGDCTLVSGGSPTDVVYQGFRPIFEEWTDNQPTNVDVTGSPFAEGVSGSYDVSELDVSTPYVDDVTYHFGDFTAAADNPGGIGPGAKTVDGATTFDSNILNVFLGDGNHVEIDTVPGEFTNYLYSTPTESGDWVEYAGSSTPTLLYDTLTNPSFPAEVFNVADYMPPDAWLPDFSSMFPPGLV